MSAKFYFVRSAVFDLDGYASRRFEPMRWLRNGRKRTVAASETIALPCSSSPEVGSPLFAGSLGSSAPHYLKQELSAGSAGLNLNVRRSGRLYSFSGGSRISVGLR